jgi:hypothetical protein
MAKPIPTTKPTRKPKNNTKHQRGDKNGLKLTGPHPDKDRVIWEFRVPGNTITANPISRGL